jgi:large subunit ribosomal protein L29
MKPNDIRKLNGAELQKKRAVLTQELFNLKFQMNTGRLENTAKLGQIRRDIARINTILTESRG